MDQNLAALHAIAAQITAAFEATREATEGLRADANRVHLAEFLAEEGVLEGARISVLDWADEAHEDGTYDVDVYEVYDADGEFVADIGGIAGAVAAGHLDGDGEPVGTDWDIFMNVNENVFAEPTIEASKVYAWVRTFELT